MVFIIYIIRHIIIIIIIIVVIIIIFKQAMAFLNTFSENKFL